MSKSQHFRPNSRGIIEQTSKIIKTGGHITHYIKRNLALSKIDRLINQEKPRIAITRRQGGIGDVLMTLPTVKAIAQKYDILIDYGTDFNYLGGALLKVLDGNPYIRSVKPWDTLEIEDYDTVIDLTCPCVMYERPKVDPINRIDLFAKHAGVSLSDHSIDYYIKPEERKWADSFLQEKGLVRPNWVVLVQLATTSIYRDGPSDKIKEAIKNLLNQNKNIHAILITHSSDTLKYDWNISRLHHARDLDVREIAALIEKVDLVICPDSSILHLASALHQKTLTLFGPTDPRARINYHPEAVAIWPAQHLQNYPIWYEQSTDGYMCWKLIDHNLITQAIISMLHNKPLPVSNDFLTFGIPVSQTQKAEIL